MLTHHSTHLWHILGGLCVFHCTSSCIDQPVLIIWKSDVHHPDEVKRLCQNYLLSSCILPSWLLCCGIRETLTGVLDILSVSVSQALLSLVDRGECGSYESWPDGDVLSSGDVFYMHRAVARKHSTVRFSLPGSVSSCRAAC